MRVLALTPNLYGRSPGQRSSIELWEKVLTPAGIFLDHHPFETDRLREVVYRRGLYGRKLVETVRAYRQQLGALRTVDDYDAVLIYREAALIGPELIERLAARHHKPIIYQLDDPLYVRYRSPFSGYLSYLKFSGKVGRICRMSRVVIVNSRFHGDYARRFNANVREIPSVVDADRYFPAPGEGSDGRVCVGWSGSASTAGNLEVIARPIAELARQREVELRFIGVEEPPFGGVEAVIQPWRPETEVDDLRWLDVGLLPVPVTEWNKRKFFLKLVQYMALGIPPVCTPLGANPDVVDHGRTGFLPGSDREWATTLLRLVDDLSLRAEVGARAAEVARERYTLQANAERIVEAFRSATG